VFISLLASSMLADTIENTTTVITKSTVIVDFSMSLFYLRLAGCT